MASTLDPFTIRRLKKFVEIHRTRSGQLPTLRDLREGGFDESLISSAIKSKVLDEFYVTLTNGSVVKGYKVVEAKQG